jgi:hypothetical protein
MMLVEGHFASKNGNRTATVEMYHVAWVKWWNVVLREYTRDTRVIQRAAYRDVAKAIQIAQEWIA